MSTDPNWDVISLRLKKYGYDFKTLSFSQVIRLLKLISEVEQAGYEPDPKEQVERMVREQDAQNLARKNNESLPWYARE